jgi:hypothetical protein
VRPLHELVHQLLPCLKAEQETPQTPLDLELKPVRVDVYAHEGDGEVWCRAQH